MSRRRLLSVLSILVALLLPASAQAHISLHPNTVPTGAFATLDLGYQTR